MLFRGMEKFSQKYLKILYLQEPGQALVEAALIIPILLMILMMIFAMGVRINWQYNLNNIASSGVSAMALSGRQCEGEKIFSDSFKNLKDIANLTIEINGIRQSPTIAIAPSTTKFFTQGDLLSVKISYKIPIELAFFFDSTEKGIINNLFNVFGSYTLIVQKTGTLDQLPACQAF